MQDYELNSTVSRGNIWKLWQELQNSKEETRLGVLAIRIQNYRHESGKHFGHEKLEGVK